MIKCENASVTYGNYVACENVNFSINSGDYLCIVGANGSGKTTIVKATLGLLPLNKGKISKSNWKIGYLPQQSSIQRDFPASVREVVLSGCIKKNLFYSKDDKKMADMQIEKLGLSGIAKKSYRDLSGGQQQRVLLARALCAGKDLLVLDEPVTGLDPVVTDELYSTIRELNHKEKIAVIMVSHDVNRAVQNATHILHMDRKPLFFGTSADYEKTELYKTMTNVEVCETHLCHHCGTGCHASHV